MWQFVLRKEGSVPPPVPLSAASMHSSSRPLDTCPFPIGPGRRYSARGKRRGGKSGPIKSCTCGWTWERTNEQTGSAGWAGPGEDVKRVDKEKRWHSVSVIVDQNHEF